MLEFVTQIFAAFGPLTLTVMGLVVSIRPPKAEGHAHWIWLAAFVAVGLPTALSTFVELRGTDTLLAQIWERVEKPIASKEGARFFLTSGPLNRETKTMNIFAINRGDVVARASIEGVDDVIYVDHILSEKEEDDFFKDLETGLPAIGTGIDFLQGVGRTMTIDLPRTEADFDNMLNNKGYIYVLFLISFTDETTPPGKRFFASLCSRYQGTLSVPKICFGHNESRQFD
jgi:hypothetical protein